MNGRRLLMGALFLTGCVVGPDYTPPNTALPEPWQYEEDITLDEPYVDWWNTLSDPLLQKYIELAYRFNNNVLSAEANILKARAVKAVATSKLLPQIYGDFNASRTYFSLNGPLFAANSFSAGLNPVTGLPFAIQIPKTQNLFNALIDVSWEIDFFGKNERNIEAAEAGIGIAFESRNATLLSTLAAVASSYIEIRSYQRRGVLIEQNIALLEKNREVAQKQFESGYRNRLDYDTIESELLSAEAALPDIYASIIRNIYALSVLTGALPETFLEELCPMAPLPEPPQCVAMGLRSDLLRRRPDVRMAERGLAQAVANIGVAVAAFFPTITISGDIGFQSLKLSNLFQGRSRTGSMQGDVNVPIFTGGSLTGNLIISEASAKAAVYNYQETVLNALEETEGSLISYIQDLKTAELYRLATEKTAEVAELTRTRYAQGLVGVTDLLDRERELITVELNLLDSRTASLLDLITLYKALGGGWQFIESLPAPCECS